MKRLLVLLLCLVPASVGAQEWQTLRQGGAFSVLLPAPMKQVVNGPPRWAWTAGKQYAFSFSEVPGLSAKSAPELAKGLNAVASEATGSKGPVTGQPVKVAEGQALQVPGKVKDVLVVQVPRQNRYYVLTTPHGSEGRDRFFASLKVEKASN